ncbi:E3 ubiquitin-protein ligase TRIM31-like [Ochotona curzoniae]|uniref:E3 ubiquitin-protein ligase TRIM31-like n=1 Tax=Ochotona curzoniae TaxID=130825 RepID=UPI001B34B077|nr:E3 ubiquitin-protein ligase TRIM31-like [Ochotona curzoniae]
MPLQTVGKRGHRGSDFFLPPSSRKECREQIQLHVDVLEQKEQELVHMKAQDEEKIINFMDLVKFEKQRVHTEFKHLHQMLEEKESIVLSSIKWVEEEGAKKCEHYNTSTQEQLMLLKQLKDSLKAKQQMPPRQLLQDIKDILHRSEEFQFQLHHSTPIPLDLEKQLNEAKSRNDSIIESLKKLGAPVTFNMASAHPDLSLSQDLKTVTLVMMRQNSSKEPVDPQRFFPFRCVLGSPGFSTGRHTWEVELSGHLGRACDVGVAWEQVPRKGSLTLEPASGFWLLHITRFECHVLTGRDSRENLQVCPRRVGVCLDLEGKEVSFYDADTNNHIYTFQASFQGKIFPFFRLLFSGTQITLSP